MPPPTNPQAPLPTASTSSLTPSSTAPQTPRVVIYAQTHHTPSGTPNSLLPLLPPSTDLTHLIIAALHLNASPGDITLNDHPPLHPRHSTLWAEVKWLQGAGVKVLGMLGGAAKGSYARLSGGQEEFEAYYGPLAEVVRETGLQGLDLDVEEEVPLPAIIRLIDRLRADFGREFLITLAPVATALLPGLPHLSGFSYFNLHRERGQEVAWYNTQFYCNWGDASTPAHYAAIVAQGWPAEKVVLGLVTNPGNGAGYVRMERLRDVLLVLRARFPGFGGVMGWEYFNGRGGMWSEGQEERPWEWVREIGEACRARVPEGLVGGGWGVERVGMGSSASEVVPAAPAEKDVEMLVTLGFGRFEAVRALNMTSGDVELAAGLLFEQSVGS